ncbi:hypothetical protein [Candidatus Mycoplasma haematohominis]|uniref:hypothetical protein n=1 Tax=Candidatus Mycoplasma haematohominis TaxID=1494318 RepID=UPI001C0A6DBB|nr:hypothetical protein [Candidatus Mycoplasma haemohominis]
MKDDLDRSLKSALAKYYFGMTFTEIKKHSALSQLRLTDEEIIDNRKEIKEVIDSQTKCGSSSRFCQSLEPHYILRRNQDNKLVIDTEECTKIKNYKELSEETVNKRIRKYLLTDNHKFNYKEVAQSIQSFENTTPAFLKETMDNIGNAEYLLENKYICISEHKKELFSIFAFHYILIGKYVKIIKSQELKELCVKHNFNFYKDESIDDKEGWNSILEIDLLIILDFGLESNVSKNSYYLDVIPDLLYVRNNKNKPTLILTPASWVLIEEDLQINNYYRKEVLELQKIKAQELKNAMKIFYPKEN